MQTHSQQFDTQLNQLNHFINFPAMRPYIGHNYGLNNNTKILLIAESNYLPEDSVIHKNAEVWYNSSQLDLNTKEINWIHCRQLCENDWKDNGLMLYRELEQNLQMHFKSSVNKERAMTNIAFMNAFQRPSPKMGESIKHYLKESDYKISSDVISQVISIIDPDLVVFVSKLAWDRLKSRLKIENSKLKIDFTCHPASGGRYWHNKQYRNGKEKFNTILNQNIISNK